MGVQPLCRLLRQAEDITLLVHQNPDGDAVGSSAALQRALQSLGKKTRIVCTQSFPDIFISIVGAIKTDAKLPKKTDLLVILDCSEFHRTGFAKQLKLLDAKKIAVIDHHESGDLHKLANIYSDPTACSSTELVFYIINELRVAITSEIATAILMGIYTDTGAFQHTNTTSGTLTLAARLVRYGADLPRISTTFLQTFSRAKRRLWGKALSEITVNSFGVVCAIVTKKIISDAGAEPTDLSGLANLLALTNEARASMVLVETDQGWRGVLRTRYNNIDLGRLATLLGGKGHKKAAGFTATKSSFSGKISK